MPKSRREKPIALTATKKATRVIKDRLLSSLRSSLSLYSSLYVLHFHSPRNSRLKALREEWGSSRFFLGKNRVMQAALGRSVTEEQAVGLSSLTPYITGHRGLLLTNTAREEVLSFFQHFSEPHYARSGCIAPRRFLIEKGPCAEERIGHAMEPHLRKLGLPTRLHEGKVEVLQDVVVCKEGDVLTPEQCRLLQLFGEKMAVFRVEVVVGWDAETGQVEELIEGATKERVKGGGERVGRTKRAGGATTGREEEGKEKEEEEEEVEDNGEGEGEGEGEEFVPEPMEGWGEVSVPSY